MTRKALAWALLAVLPLLAQRKDRHIDLLTYRDGLSQSVVTSILQDHQGYLWFGTQEGLNRYDGYRFTTYSQRSEAEGSVANDWIRCLYEDGEGRLWVGSNGGIDRYDRDLDRFTHCPLPDETSSVIEVTALVGTRIGGTTQLWIGTTNKGLFRYEPDWDRFTAVAPPQGVPLEWEVSSLALQGKPGHERIWIGGDHGLFSLDPKQSKPVPSILRSEKVLTLLADQRQETLWIATAQGLIRRDDRGQFLPLAFGGLPSLEIRAMAPHGDRELWLATQRGVFALDPIDARLTDFTHEPEQLKAFIAVLEDRSGVLWMGTLGHWLFRYDLNKERFAHYRHFEDDPDSLANNLVFNILESRDGHLWIATGAGGVDELDPTVGKFLHHAPQVKSDRGMPEERFYALAECADGTLLLGGASQGLFRYARNGNIVAHYSSDPDQANSLPGNGMRVFYRDRRNQLWIGTTRGLCRFDETSERFTRAPLGEAANRDEAINVQHIRELNGALWLATLGSGLMRYEPESGKVTRFLNDRNDAQSLGDDQVLSVFAKPSNALNTLWIGTLGGGLNRLDTATGKMRRYTTNHGLPNNVVYAIASDPQENLWVSTNRGLARFDAQDESFTVYSDEHGLQGPEFSQRAVTLSRDGRLFFGGNNGLSAFDPLSLARKEEVPPLALTDFRIFNASMANRIGQADCPLEKPIWATRQIVLHAHQNVFSFEFAVLNAAAPASVQYAYKLEGLYQDWIPASAENRWASFTNLGQGHYTLKVRARTADSAWREMAVPLLIQVKPPLYKSWWAYLLYLAALLSLVVYYLRNQARQLAWERNEREQQNLINERLRQMDKFKDEILANTSHELRTPLHGIIGLADSLRDGSAGPLPEKALRNLDMIVSSGKRLTSLVNDILDFSKLRSRKLELQKAPVNLYTLTEMVLTLSRPLLAGKDLELINSIPTSLPPVQADENRLQQILHNLVGNAIKFTSHGFVKVTATVDAAGENLCLQVIDTGIGIPEYKLESIFNAFEQADSSSIRSFGGTGLGLAITKHLVALHGGTITVNSVPDKGSVFSFSLPLADVQGAVSDGDFETSARIHSFLELPAEPAPEILPAAGGEIPEEIAAELADRRILIVDDEPINRQVLVNYLAPLGCQLEEASQGSQALAMVADNGPYDLVLLDIMMPRMSGYEVCSEIRQTHSLSELPIIFLTAKNQSQDLVEGFVSGANDYLTKPIAKSELIARVRAHLRLLHFNRSLEAKVAERTRELRAKNSELDAKYHELETFNNIVKAINRAVELDKVVDILLEQGLVLFPSARSASFAIWDTARRGFVFTGAKGYSPAPFHERILPAEAIESWSGFGRAEHRGVTILDHPRADVLDEAFGDLPKPLSQVVLTISSENRLHAIMTLDNHEREYAFSSLDFDKLMRFREHAVNAVARARVVDELVGTQNQLVEAANLAGKAEIATNVLHNVGNTLNSVRTSIHMIQENMCGRKWLNLFQKIVDMLHGNQEELDRIFTSPSRRQTLVSALDRIWQNFQHQSTSLDNESKRLVDHVQSIVSVLIEQERHTQFKGSLSTTLSVNDVIEETIRMEAYLLKHKRLELRLRLGEVPQVRAEKSKMVLILFNLLKNSWQAIEEINHGHGLIEISSWAGERCVWMEVRDNGIGVPAQNLVKLCEQGFTTKKHCEGFGLHYVANTMHDMCGTIKIESEGLGKGCRVQLSFPLAEEKPLQLDTFLVQEALEDQPESAVASSP